MELKVPTFKNTQDALAYAKKASREQLYDMCHKKAQIEQELNPLNPDYDELQEQYNINKAFQGQFIREAFLLMCSEYENRCVHYDAETGGCFIHKFCFEIKDSVYCADYFVDDRDDSNCDEAHDDWETREELGLNI